MKNLIILITMLFQALMALSSFSATKSSKKHSLPVCAKPKKTHALGIGLSRFSPFIGKDLEQKALYFSQKHRVSLFQMALGHEKCRKEWVQSKRKGKKISSRCLRRTAILDYMMKDLETLISDTPELSRESLKSYFIDFVRNGGNNPAQLFCNQAQTRRQSYPEVLTSLFNNWNSSKRMSRKAKVVTSDESLCYMTYAKRGKQVKFIDKPFRKIFNFLNDHHVPFLSKMAKKTLGKQKVTLKISKKEQEQKRAQNLAEQLQREEANNRLLRQDVQRIGDDLALAQADIARIEGEKRFLQENVRRVQDDFAKAREEIARQEGEIERINREIARARAEEAQVGGEGRREREALQKQIRDLEKRHDEAVAALAEGGDEHQRRMAAKMAEAEELRRQLAEQAVALEAKQAEILRAQESAERIDGEFRAEKEQLLGQVARGNWNILSKAQEIADLRRQVDGLRDQLSAEQRRLQSPLVRFKGALSATDTLRVALRVVPENDGSLTPKDSQRDPLFTYNEDGTQVRLTNEERMKEEYKESIRFNDLSYLMAKQAMYEYLVSDEYKYEGYLLKDYDPETYDLYKNKKIDFYKKKAQALKAQIERDGYKIIPFYGKTGVAELGKQVTEQAGIVVYHPVKKKFYVIHHGSILDDSSYYPYNWLDNFDTQKEVSPELGGVKLHRGFYRAAKSSFEDQGEGKPGIKTVMASILRENPGEFDYTFSNHSRAAASGQIATLLFSQMLKDTSGYQNGDRHEIHSYNFEAPQFIDQKDKWQLNDISGPNFLTMNVEMDPVPQVGIMDSLVEAIMNGLNENKILFKEERGPGGHRKIDLTSYQESILQLPLFQSAKSRESVIGAIKSLERTINSKELILKKINEFAARSGDEAKRRELAQELSDLVSGFTSFGQLLEVPLVGSAAGGSNPNVTEGVFERDTNAYMGLITGEILKDSKKFARKDKRSHVQREALQSDAVGKLMMTFLAPFHAGTTGGGENGAFSQKTFPTADFNKYLLAPNVERAPGGGNSEERGAIAEAMSLIERVLHSSSETNPARGLEHKTFLQFKKKVKQAIDDFKYVGLGTITSWTFNAWEGKINTLFNTVFDAFKTFIKLSNNPHFSKMENHLLKIEGKLRPALTLFFKKFLEKMNEGDYRAAGVTNFGNLVSETVGNTSYIRGADNKIEDNILSRRWRMVLWGDEVGTPYIGRALRTGDSGNINTFREKLKDSRFKKAYLSDIDVLGKALGSLSSQGPNWQTIANLFFKDLLPEGREAERHMTTLQKDLNNLTFQYKKALSKLSEKKEERNTQIHNAILSFVRNLSETLDRPEYAIFLKPLEGRDKQDFKLRRSMILINLLLMRNGFEPSTPLKAPESLSAITEEMLNQGHGANGIQRTFSEAGYAEYDEIRDRLTHRNLDVKHPDVKEAIDKLLHVDTDEAHGLDMRDFDAKFREVAAER